MKISRLISFLLIFLFCQCEKKVKFINKDVIIKGTTNKITIQVPEKCGDFSEGVKMSLDAIVKYAGQDASLKATYDKVNIISEFSQRIKTITIAQCKIIQNSVVFDPNESDQVFYNQLVNDYIQYQKLRDFTQLENLNEEQRKLIATAITEVYTNIYTNKKDEVIAILKDLKLTIKAIPTSNVTVKINGENVCMTAVDIDGIAVCFIPKKYLVPKPNEEYKIDIILASVGYADNIKTYSLGSLVLLEKKSGIIEFKENALELKE